MSEVLRIALVAEGVTDYEILNAAIENMLSGRPFILRLLQPEGSVAFTGGGNAGTLGGGWKGVYQWCLQAAQRGNGKLSGDPIFIGYDMLVVHLDADVADENPANNHVDPIPALAGVLPCAQPCPPPNATTNALRKVMLLWVGEVQMPPKTIFCTPSKSTEAWVMEACFPNDTEVLKSTWECHPNPESRLGQQPVRTRFAKSQQNYAARKFEFQAGWPRIVGRFTEAQRFHNDFMAAIP